MVWLLEEHRLGEVTEMGAFYSTIKYVKGGIEYEVLMENEEFVLLEELIEYVRD